MAKITELLQKKQFSFSFEVTPDVSEHSLDDLPVEPTFLSITWHAKSHRNKSLDIPPLKTARYLRSKGKNILLHISCDYLKKEFLLKLLQNLQENDIRNLFVILGEGYEPSTSEFKESQELIKLIREKTSDFFCIGVAGSLDANDDKLNALKGKIDAGADFIITQAFFDPIDYTHYVQRCSCLDIRVPIIPGVFHFETCEQLSNFINLCRIKVSDDLLQSILNDESRNCLKGFDVSRKLIHAIHDKEFHHFHFFTLNRLESVAELIEKLF